MEPSGSIFIVAFLVQAGVGLAIGAARKRPVVGLVMGALLGVIGWGLLFLFEKGKDTPAS